MSHLSSNRAHCKTPHYLRKSQPHWWGRMEGRCCIQFCHQMKAAIASPFCNITVLKNTSHNLSQRPAPTSSAVHRHNPSVWHTQFIPYNEKGELGVFFPHVFSLSFSVSNKRKRIKLFSKLMTKGSGVHWQHSSDTFSSQNPNVGGSDPDVGDLMWSPLFSWETEAGEGVALPGRERNSRGVLGLFPTSATSRALSASHCWQMKQWH